MSDRSVFDEVKGQVDLVDYLTRYCGAEFVADGPNRLASCCPFHQEDTPSFKVEPSVTGEGMRWRCYGACATGGSVIDAAMMQEGMATPLEAIEYLSDLYDLGIAVDHERFQRFRESVAETKEAIERTQKEMQEGGRAALAAREYLLRRGFDEATVEHFGLAVDTSRSRAGRLSIPIYDKAGHPVSISNRALFDNYPCANCGELVSAKDVVARRHRAQRAMERGEEFEPWETCPHCGADKSEARISWLVGQHPKYLNEGGFDKSHILYNEPAARNALRDPETIGYLIVEGYADVWALHQSGHKAASSYNGATISDWQAEEAGKLCVRDKKPLILIPDFDATGLAKATQNIRAIRSISPEVEIRVVSDLGYRENGEQIKDCGELLQLRGGDALYATVLDNHISADEWMIREIVEAVNPNTGQPFHSLVRQIELVSEILGEVRHRIALDHLVPWLAERWQREPEQVRRFVHERITGAEVASAQHIMASVSEARAAAVEYVKDPLVIPTGFEEIDACFYGGGLRPGWMSLVIAQSGSGKTSLALQMMQNMVRAGVSCIFFSLEQPKAQLYLRMVQQTLGVSQREAGELVLRNDPALDELEEIWREFIIVDNTPGEDGVAMDINAFSVKKIIQEANLTRLDRPVQVCFIDHLGIMLPTPDAPKMVKESDAAAAGWIVREMFEHTVKALGVCTLILQQTAKHSKPGTEIGADDGYGGSLQKNFSDCVFTMWRPEQEPGISDEERVQREGRVKMRVAKNRHGPEKVSLLHFDWRTLRIMPALHIAMPVADDQRADAIDLDAPRESSKSDADAEAGLDTKNSGGNIIDAEITDIDAEEMVIDSTNAGSAPVAEEGEARVVAPHAGETHDAASEQSEPSSGNSAEEPAKRSPEVSPAVRELLIAEESGGVVDTQELAGLIEGADASEDLMQWYES